MDVLVDGVTVLVEANEDEVSVLAILALSISSLGVVVAQVEVLVDFKVS